MDRREVERKGYTIKEFAQMWGLSEGTVKYWVSAKKIPSLKLLGKRIIPAWFVESLESKTIREWRECKK